MMRLEIADLFCGAGGTSQGAIEAIEALGFEPGLTAINHWDVAIATHTQNHPGARHLCTGIDSVNPTELYKGSKLDILWASPECTHHSVARGGKPINDQSRATAFCVVRWAEALRPGLILVENVPEFLTWGPIGSDNRPLKSRKGEIFKAWVAALEAIGYKVDWRILCAADYGDPTTRRRVFVQAVRGKRKIVWPEPTHSVKAKDELFGRKQWIPARDIIDWKLPSQSIYERKKALSPKTMRRIMAGLEKFGLKPFIVPQQSNPTPKGVDEPLPTVVAEGSGPKLATPFLVRPAHGNDDATSDIRRVHSIEKTLGVVPCSGEFALVEPFILSAGGPECAARSVSKPMGTVLTRDHRAIVEPRLTPFMVPGFGEDAGQAPRTHDIEKPAPTVAAGGHIGLVEPFLICMEHGGCERDINRPMPTVTTAKGGAIGVADPFLVKLRGTNDAADVNKPVPTVTASGTHLALAEPFLIHTAHVGERSAAAVDAPLATVAGNRGDLALVEASLLPQNQGGILRPVSEPAPTVATAGAVALVEPYLVKYYGAGNGSASVDDPLATVTAQDRFGLVRPVVVIDGERYILDIRFRMLQPKELAGAQGFKKDYVFTGTKTEQVKQIGNAVPRNLARAIVLAALSQNADITAPCSKVA